VEEDGGERGVFGERGQPVRGAKSGDKPASRPASLLPDLPSRRRARPHTLTSAPRTRRLTTGRAGRRREARRRRRGAGRDEVVCGRREGEGAGEGEEGVEGYGE